MSKIANLALETVARADLTRMIPVYDSRLEEDWAECGAIILENTPKIFDGNIQVSLSLYHWMSFVCLPEGSYTPDFMHILSDGRQVFVEIKGKRKLLSYDRSWNKLKSAASLNPWFIFVMATASQEHGGYTWELKGVPYESGYMYRHVIEGGRILQSEIAQEKTLNEIVPNKNRRKLVGKH